MNNAHKANKRFMVKKISDGELIQTKPVHKNKYSEVQILGNSKFHNATNQAAKTIQDKIDSTLKMKPCRTVDPSTLECPQLTGIDLKRAKAKRMLQKYPRRGEFMTCMWHKSRYMALTEQECDAIMRAVESFKQRDEEKKKA